LCARAQRRDAPAVARSLGGLRYRRGPILRTTLAEKLADDIFHRQLLDIDVRYGTGAEQLATNFRDLCPRKFQLHTHRRLLDHFAESSEIAALIFREGKADNLVPGKAIDNRAQFAIKKDFPVINYDHPITKFLDVLHVMTGEHGHDPMLLVVETEEFTHPLLANDIEPNRRLIEKKNSRLLNERGEMLPFHPLP